MSVAKHHVEWLSLVEHSGPFLSVKVLTEAFGEGLQSDDSDVRAELRLAHAEWTESRGTPDETAVHTAWVQFVLQQVLEFDEDVIREGPELSDALRLGSIRPSLAVVNPAGRVGAGKARLLVRVHPPETHLDKPEAKDAINTPTSDMRALLHHAQVPLGLVTNGEEWRVVSAKPGEPTGLASWYASVWLDEPLTLRAFQSLFGMGRFFAVADDETIEKLYEKSAEDTEEVTNQLGAQVRRSVEILVQDIDRLDADSGRELLEGVSEKKLYEAAVTVMMRLVFLLSAEERGLLRLGQHEYDAAYAVSTLREQLREVADKQGEEVLQYRFDAWARLLANFRAVHGGVQHEALKLPAYKGSLFDPDRFPFLEGRLSKDEAPDPLNITSRTVLHLLESVQLLEVKVGRGIAPERRKLSFKSLSVEQIGYVYEGLLDHTAKRAQETVLGLQGGKDKEPEIRITELVDKLEQGPEAFAKAFKKPLGRSEKSILNALEAAFEDIEPQRLERLRVVCGQDEDLVDLVRPFMGLVRDDVFGYPVVFRAGAVFVTTGDDRRTTGTHYTPPQITEPIVKHALNPVLYDGPAEGKPEDEWVLKPARAILDLKVCDFAMGSGAFLVQAIRYLGDRLVEAWAKAEREAGGGQLLVTPEGAVSEGHPHERPLPDDRDERVVLARRAVASRCIYGVDKNPMAVELAKLSLWLETLEKNKPFTFLDHALKAGDALFGLTDPEQIRRFHWFPDRGAEVSDQGDFFQGLFGLDPLLEEATKLRKRIESYTVEEERDADAKKKDLEAADRALFELRVVADVLAAAAKEAGGKTDDKLTKAIQAWSGKVGGTLRLPRLSDERRSAFERLWFEATKVLATDEKGPWTPFHWALEFPEVVSAGGFDAFVGNPPFQGGQKLTGALGTGYRELLVEHLGRAKRGSADLCAYFFLRAHQLLSERGGFGLVATNTVAQGDTREVGLDQLVEDGGVVHRAVPSEKWPGDANLEIARVWARRSGGRWSGSAVLAGKRVREIGPYLVVPGTTVGPPQRLAANAGKSFQGSIVLGLGFTMTPEEAEALIAKDPRNADVLFPYLNGKDLNSHPEQKPSRWVINFFDWPLERAADYPDCLRIVEEKVKPERDRNKRKARRERWWQYAERASSLYEAIAGKKGVLVRSRVGDKHVLAYARAPAVFSERLVVLVSASFAVLQSGLHEAWARRYGSTLRTDLMYSPTDCFETFPFPESMNPTAAVGETYHERRREWMLREQLGLTAFYNHLHDPAEKDPLIQSMRDLTVDLDNEVRDLYGWSDLDLQHDFHETRLGPRFGPSDAAKADFLNRLLALNHERYAAEQAAAGKTPTKKKRSSRKKTSTPRKRTSRAPKPTTPSLFEESES